MIAYNIEMRAVESDEAWDTCQLRSRHWVIKDGTGKKDEVRGPGVVGYFPVLRRDGQHCSRDGQTLGGEMKFVDAAFVYQSCSGRVKGIAPPDNVGSFGGDIQFAPGTLAKPDGADFDVFVDPFELTIPKFIY